MSKWLDGLRVVGRIVKDAVVDEFDRPTPEIARQPRSVRLVPRPQCYEVGGKYYDENRYGDLEDGDE